MRKGIFVFLAAALLLVSPAWADKTVTLHVSADEAPATATVVTSALTFDTSGYGFMSCAVNITAGSGTSTIINIWLQGSYDDGTTWADLLFASGFTTTASDTAPPGTLATWPTAANPVPRREIVAGTTAITSGQFVAALAGPPPPRIRAAWEFTWSVQAHETFALICTLKD